MVRKSSLVVLLLAFCLGFGSDVWARRNAARVRRNADTVIVIRDAELDNDNPGGLRVKCGQSLQVYHRAGNRLYVYVNVPGDPQGRNWGWIDSGCVLALDQAVPHFTKILQQAPNDATAYLGRAAAEQALEQYDEVIADCNRAVELDPKAVSAFYLRAAAWIATKQPEKAIADLDVVLRLEPDHDHGYMVPDACRLRADLWREQKNYEKAIADYSRLLRLHPHDCNAYCNRALCRYCKKDYEKAIADCNEVLSRQPETIDAYRYRAFARMRLRFYDKAVEDFSESIRLEDQQAANLYGMGWTFFLGGDFRRAIDVFTQFHVFYIYRANDYVERAICRYSICDDVKALADYNEALRIDPDSSRAHFCRGLYWERKKRFDLAMADIEAFKPDARKSGGNGAVTYFVARGNCWSAMGQYDKALADLDEALRLGPDDHGACNAASWFRATCGGAKYRDGKQAIALGIKACQATDWDDYAILDTLAAAHAEAGNFDEAVRWQKKAVGLAPPVTKKDMTERLALYQAHKPYRAPVETGKGR